MTDSKDGTNKVKRAGSRRDSEGRGDRRTLSMKFLMGDEEPKDFGSEGNRRKDDRRTSKDRRD